MKMSSLFDIKTGVISLEDYDETANVIQFDYTKKNEELQLLQEICLDLKNYNVELLQVPQEKVIMSINVKISCTERNQWNNKLEYFCNINLIFENELHKMQFCSDYEYKVFCRICLESTFVNEDDGLPYIDYLQLLSVKKRRCSDELKCTSKSHNFKDLYLNKLKHICIGIRRCKIIKTIRHWGNNNIHVLEKMKNGLYSDISLICNNKRIPAHKHVLSLHSPVFNAMFSHEMLEKQEGIVKIEDFDSQVIEEMLNFIYTGKVKAMDSVALELYKVAEKYEIQQLIELCTEYFIFNLNPDNVVDILDVVTIYNQTTLLKAIKKYIIENQTIMKRKDYQDYICRNFKEETMEDIFILCVWYPFMPDVKLKALEFVKIHKEILKNENFLNAIYPHEELMKEMIKFLAE